MLSQGIRYHSNTSFAGEIPAKMMFCPKVRKDYYPFGMLMPGRHYTTGSASLAYRYGFNGKEKDNEVYGTGNSYDFGARMYDPRVGRFLSIDPRWKEFPFWSPYVYAGNNPIRFVDVNGEGPGDWPFTGRATINAGSVQIFRITTAQRVVMNTSFAAATVLAPGGTAMTVSAEGYKFASNPGMSSAGSLRMTAAQEGTLFAADAITAHGAKDAMVGANQKTVANLNKGVKATGNALGGLSILMNAIDTDPTRQESLEKMTFDIASKMYGDINIVNDGLFKFDQSGTQSPEMAERSMNRIFNSLSTLLPEGQYDLTSKDGISAAYEVIGANMNNIVRDIQKNIPLTRDTDEQKTFNSSYSHFT